MSRLLRVLVGIPLLAVGTLLVLYGLFAIVYGGDSRGGDTYVTWAGHELDADLAGAIAVVVGAVLVVAAVAVVRRRRLARQS